MGEGLIVRRGTPKGTLPAGSEKYYWLGDENIPITGGWQIGYSTGTGTQSKNTDHFYFSTAVGIRTYECLQADLTEIKIINVEVSDFTLTGTYFESLVIGVGGAAGQRLDTSALKFSTFANPFDILSIDVTNITGIRRIGVSLKTANGISNSIKILKIWGEK